MSNRQKKIPLNRKAQCGEVEKEMGPPSVAIHVDLKKEYSRFCKLYSSEPLDIVSTPLERASYERDNITVDLKGRGLRGVDCIALGKIFATDVPITFLNLSDCLLMPQGFQALLDGICKNSKLKSLELRGNNIGSNMVVALGKLLKQNSNLSELLLEWNCLGDSKECFRVFAEGLSVNTGLEILDLRNNQITPEIATDLANGIKHNKTLREIDLRWNSIGLLGAKSLWDALRTNITLSKISLCGNFIPEDIVTYIEHCLSERQQRDALIEESGKRSIILKEKLAKKEEEYERELHSVVSVFNEEEAGLKKVIQDGLEEIAELNAQIFEKTNENETLNEEVNNLKFSLQKALEREETLMNGIRYKENECSEIRESLNFEMNSARQSFELKIGTLNDEVALKMKELQVMLVKVKDLEIQVSDKNLLIEHLNDLVEKMKQNSQKSEVFFEERIQAEKEKWGNWKLEVETAEREEIAMLENQIKEIQQSMMDHIRMIEKGKTEAEEEIRKLKMNLITIRSEADENLTKLRNSLKEENDELAAQYLAQIGTLKDSNDKVELELRKYESQVRKLQSDNDSLCRESETLRTHNATMTQELAERDTANHSALIRAQNDSKERVEHLKKEQETNEALRMEILELQEQLAMLTIKHAREISEKFAEVQKWKVQNERKDADLARLKEDDVKRATLLQDAFLAYMQSTAIATGIPLGPLSSSTDALNGNIHETGESPNTHTDRQNPSDL